MNKESEIKIWTNAHLLKGYLLGQTGDIPEIIFDAADEIIAMIDLALPEEIPSPSMDAPPRVKRATTWSPEQRAAQAARMRARMAKKHGKEVEDGPSDENNDDAASIPVKKQEAAAAIDDNEAGSVSMGAFSIDGDEWPEVQRLLAKKWNVRQIADEFGVPNTLMGEFIDKHLLADAKKSDAEKEADDE